ncbi:right-handed parallel beta-helix repeat-containing protein [Ensifer sesbaniae]|uniref:right-handed parallel beta-helix repeat-containing protein n=1 Tax=Ensifer sesbaniae TaxID=1214071 RepID=UPI00200115F4|nr:right-handed parallel beta-helix repeat-containing protein [Ensifer sesbaniae]
MRAYICPILVVTLLAGPCDARTDIIGALVKVEHADNGSTYLQGWACQIGVANPVSVRVTFGKPAPSGVALFSTIADNRSVPTAAGNCSPPRHNHGFQIALSELDAKRFAGQKIFIYGVTPDNNANGAELENSGAFVLPKIEYDSVNCDDWDGLVDRNIQLQPENCQIHKQIVFNGPNLSLDCNGATIDGTNLPALSGSRGQGIGAWSAKAECERSKLVGTDSRFLDADATGSLIQNCRVQNFAFGIYFNRRAWTKPKVGEECVPYREYSELNSRNASKQGLDDTLGGRDKRYPFSAADVTVRNVEATKIRDSGIFVNEYGRNWLVEDSKIVGNGVGIYLERESRQNRIITNIIANNGNVGVAIDASARNLIEKNLIEGNGAIGVALYKNCGESGGVTRYQHANNNILRGNIIRGQGGARIGGMTLTMSYLLASSEADKIKSPGVGVWIASRQGLSRLWMERATGNPSLGCSDVGYNIGEDTLYQDYASNNQIINNRIYDNSLADVIVEDDNNRITRNDFSSGTGAAPLAGIVIGSVFRQQEPKLRPVGNVYLSGNVLPKITLGDSVLYIGGSEPIE